MSDDKGIPARVSAMWITRKLEFDAGHRIPNHESKCRNVHGHRYVLECTVTGKIVDTSGHSSEGMVVDFSVLKQLMNDLVVEPWDHAMLVWQGDKHLLGALSQLWQHKTVTLPVIPTAENLAKLAFEALAPALASYGLRLTHVRLYETPNCWADCYDLNE